MAEVKVRGKWNIVNDTASEVQSFIILSISSLALKRLVDMYTGTAREHMQTVLIYTQDRLRHVAHEELAQKHDPLSGNYLDQAMQYLHDNGINL
jgi:hypothetical protein